MINLKICDNSKDCSGITVCPVGAIYWDEKKKSLAIDNNKCISCGKCELSCPVGAIRVAKIEEEYKKIKKEIDDDPRRPSDLFVDRYGAEPISPAFFIDKSKFQIQILEATQIAVVELFNNDSIECLLKSIPIKELFPDSDIKYRKIKVEGNDPLLKEYKVSRLPALLFFKDGRLMGKIEGYYNQSKKKRLKSKINRIILKMG